jgi:chitin disaccharide deacetylase
MIRLVVNAEEFGAAPEIDIGIATAHLEGIVTSTSLSGNCTDIQAARATLAKMPKLGVGLSLALIGGQPVAAPDSVSTLLTAVGSLRNTAADFAFDWWKGRIAPAHVEHELEAQLTRALDVGGGIDHLCTRGYLGFLPGVGEIIERLARRYQVSGMRTVVEPPTLGWITDPRRGVQTGILAGLSWLTRRRLGVLRHGPRSWGYLESERLDEVRIIEIIGRLGPGSHELICHPRQSDGGGLGGEQSAESRELTALTSARVKNALAGREIVLCRWRDLF